MSFLLGQPNGANYVVIYQMLCMMSVNKKGRLAYNVGEILVPYNVDKITRECKYFARETVAFALELYKKLGLIYEEEGGILSITGFDEMVGSETAAAKRKREQRAKNLPQNDGQTCLPEAQTAEEIEQNYAKGGTSGGTVGGTTGGTNGGTMSHFDGDANSILNSSNITKLDLDKNSSNITKPTLTENSLSKQSLVDSFSLSLSPRVTREEEAGDTASTGEQYINVGLRDFLSEYKNVVVDNCSCASLDRLDYELLRANFSQSRYLAGETHDLSWIVKNYRYIVSGKYADKDDDEPRYPRRRNSGGSGGRKKSLYEHNQEVYERLKKKFQMEEQLKNANEEYEDEEEQTDYEG